MEQYFNSQSRLLSKEEIWSLLQEMDEQIGNFSNHIEINIYGGAVMCLNFGNRCSTQDIDSTFKDVDIIYPLVQSLAIKHHLLLAMKLYSARLFPKSDLNDAVTLCRHLKIVTRQEAEKVLREFIDDEVIVEAKMSFLDLVIKEVTRDVK